MTTLKSLGTLAVAALAAARMTRFVTSDTLGEWTLVGPAKLWAHRRESFADVVQAAEKDAYLGKPVDTPHPSQGWRSKLVSGLDCPFCVGFWLGGIALAGAAFTRSRAPRPLRAAVSGIGGALALNYAVGHTSARLD